MVKASRICCCVHGARGAEVVVITARVELNQYGAAIVGPSVVACIADDDASDGRVLIESEASPIREAHEVGIVETSRERDRAGGDLLQIEARGQEIAHVGVGDVGSRGERREV